MHISMRVFAALVTISSFHSALASEAIECELKSVPASSVAVVPVPSIESVRDTHERLTGVLWFQTAAEYRVDSIVKYRQATEALDRALADQTWTAATEQSTWPLPSKTSVILDLDETVIDNSRFQGELIHRRSDYDPALWNSWVSGECANLVPGAIEFLRYARSKDVTLFFVTNRTASQEASTRNNLRKLGIDLPSDIDTVLTSGEKPDWMSDKTSRRELISSNYRILLLIGDDLGDFVGGAKAPPSNRTTLAQRHLDKWGSRWFLLNNPLYGSWESATNGGGSTDADILKAKMSLIRGFDP